MSSRILWPARSTQLRSRTASGCWIGKSSKSLTERIGSYTQKEPSKGLKGTSIGVQTSKTGITPQILRNRRTATGLPYLGEQIPGDVVGVRAEDYMWPVVEHVALRVSSLALACGALPSTPAVIEWMVLQNYYNCKPSNLLSVSFYANDNNHNTFSHWLQSENDHENLPTNTWSYSSHQWWNGWGYWPQVLGESWSSLMYIYPIVYGFPLPSVSEPNYFLPVFIYKTIKLL